MKNLAKIFNSFLYKELIIIIYDLLMFGIEIDI
jgi:hypothetical protein